MLRRCYAAAGLQSTSIRCPATCAAISTSRSCATTAASASSGNATKQEQNQQQSSALGAHGGSAAESTTGKRRNILVMSNTTKAVYIHRHNHIASWYWFVTDFHKWFVGFVILFVGSQVLARYRIAKMQTTVQAQLGENLLDQRTRDLLSDVEQLRVKDPLRLENEANAYHEQFWQRRAKAVAERNDERRNVEITRGLMQGEARGTDMTEWLGAKAKDDQEREVARRTQEYIQGFHQHLKAKRLI
ncbi:Hypothetical protein, putative [Bodo saltans]|uniref:Uncharacterized protein n=1 Tax=Bodo saltans TaxID=75058 RepID=A0A0S4KGJ1_BODSA|nr:Hypothetical protein, putative [Bodo saltans]|eukprot:CUI14820.1 Hypothetical protein, putative [Bodo saltans]